jgi:hypothetical protein
MARMEENNPLLDRRSPVRRYSSYQVCRQLPNPQFMGISWVFPSE